MQVVYLIIRDCGDGSSTLDAYRNKSYQEIVKILDSDDDYYANEGSPSAILKLPKDFDLNTLGLRFLD